MPTRRRPAIRALAWATFIVVCLSFQTSHGQQSPKRPFGGGTPSTGQGLGGRDCLGCHKAFATKYLGLKNVHAVVRENKCDSCHVRHGLVPTRAMKREGNDLCLTCHPKDKLGLNKAHVHTAVNSGNCILCHDPHASQFDHLLKADPAELCYLCHDKANYQKKVVHKILQTNGCPACHTTHSADEPNLLVKEEKALCLGCHAATAPEFTKAHEGYPVDRVSCSKCHDPHSSAQPRLLKTSVHAPVQAAQCDGCHAAATSPKPFDVAIPMLRATIVTLCGALVCWL